MDIVRGATRRCEVPPAQCHARHARCGAKSADPDSASVTVTVSATVTDTVTATGTATVTVLVTVPVTVTVTELLTAVVTGNTMLLFPVGTGWRSP